MFQENIYTHQVRGLTHMIRKTKTTSSENPCDTPKPGTARHHEPLLADSLSQLLASWVSRARKMQRSSIRSQRSNLPRLVTSVLLAS